MISTLATSLLITLLSYFAYSTTSASSSAAAAAAASEEGSWSIPYSWMDWMGLRFCWKTHVLGMALAWMHVSILFAGPLLTSFLAFCSRSPKFSICGAKDLEKKTCTNKNKNENENGTMAVLAGQGRVVLKAVRDVLGITVEYAWFVAASAFREVCELQGFRDYFVAPLAEEWCFRACLCSMIAHLLGPTALWSICCYSGILFGISHLHFVVERVVAHNLAFKQAFLNALFHASFTSIFGLYAATFFMTTGSLPAVVAVHCLCNWYGFPDTSQIDEELTRPLHKRLAWIAYFAGLCLFLIIWLAFIRPSLWYFPSPYAFPIS
eukprot:ANDGO_08412.mRNA.1 CAAX prenyl protease 2